MPSHPTDMQSKCENYGKQLLTISPQFLILYYIVRVMFNSVDFYLEFSVLFPLVPLSLFCLVSDYFLICFYSYPLVSPVFSLFAFVQLCIYNPVFQFSFCTWCGLRFLLVIFSDLLRLFT